MRNYNIDCYTQEEKYNVMAFIRKVGAKITDVCGYYEGFLISFNATTEQLRAIENAVYTGII